MFFKGKDGGPVDPTNRALLALFGVAVLLVFMDMQAKRQMTRKLPDLPVSIPAEDLKERVFEPIQRSAEDVLGEATEETARRIKRVNPKATAIESIEGIERLDTLERINRIEVPTRIKNVEFHLSTNGTIFLYFIRFNGKSSQLVQVKRKTPETISAGQVLELLQAGPTVRERGLLNTLDDSVRILDVRLEGKTAVVEIDASFERMGKRIVQDRLDQLAATLIQFPSIEYVTLQRNGETVHTLANGTVLIPGALRFPTREIKKI